MTSSTRYKHEDPMMQRSQACVVRACTHSAESQKQLTKATIIGPGEAKIMRSSFCMTGAVMSSILSMNTQTHREASRGEHVLMASSRDEQKPSHNWRS